MFRVVLTIVASASATSIASRALKPIYATRKTISDVKFAAHATAAASHSIISEPKIVALIMNLIPKKMPSNESFFPLPLQHTAEGIERCITFTGCGGLYTYLFGVAAYMQEAFTWDAETTAFASASAGAYPAFSSPPDWILRHFITPPTVNSSRPLPPRHTATRGCRRCAAGMTCFADIGGGASQAG